MNKTFLILQSMAFLSFLGVMLYLAWHLRQLKQQQQKILSQLKGQRFWRINIARPEFMSKWMRITPFEASGVLIDTGVDIKVQGYWQKSGKLMESSFPKTALKVQWLGNTSLRAGNLYWAQLQTGRENLLITADTGMNALQSRAALEDIFRGAFPDYPLSDKESTDFALEKNPRTKRALIVFFALMVFALLDTFVITRFELTDHQLRNILLNPVAMGALLLGYGAALYSLYRYFTAGQVPARESLVLSGLVATVCLLSLAPLAKRLDQILASTPSQNYNYRVVGVSRLEPVNTSLQLPNLYFPRGREYWTQFVIGTEYKVPFLRGPMGLWQLDHKKFDQPMLDFYQKNNP